MHVCSYSVCTPTRLLFHKFSSAIKLASALAVKTEISFSVDAVCPTNHRFLCFQVSRREWIE